MQQLRIHIRSIVPFIMVCFVGIPLIIVSITSFVKINNSLFALLISGLVTVVMYHLAKWLTDGRLNVAIDNKMLRQSWEKKPLLHTVQIKEFPLSKIVEYKHLHGRYFTFIVLIAKDGSRIRFDLNSFEKAHDEDVKKLLQQLKRIVNKNKH